MDKEDDTFAMTRKRNAEIGGRQSGKRHKTAAVEALDVASSTRAWEELDQTGQGSLTNLDCGHQTVELLGKGCKSLVEEPRDDIWTECRANRNSFQRHDLDPHDVPEEAMTSDDEEERGKTLDMSQDAQQHLGKRELGHLNTPLAEIEKQLELEKMNKQLHVLKQENEKLKQKKEELKQRKVELKQKHEELKQKNEKLKQKKEELKQRKVELKQKHEELKQKNEELNDFRRDVEEFSVLKYFEVGAQLPCLTMIGNIPGPLINKRHEPIARILLKDFGVIEMKPEDMARCIRKTANISSLSRLYTATEAHVMGHVEALLNDIMFLTKVIEWSVMPELSITELNADFWTIACHGCPVGAVVVQSPSKIDELTWDVNYGQLYDYHLRIRSFHGVKNVIGLFTNWNEWVFGWFEDCDISATATDLHYELDNEVTFSSLTPERKLHISRKYRREDLKSLAEALFSWLKKLARNATGRSVVSVPWLHPDRSYIKLTADKWVWQRGLPITELSLWPPPKNSQSFYLLHDFGAGRDGHVWLACHIEKPTKEGGVGKLAVLKFLALEEGNVSQLAQTEVARWRKLGISSVYSILLSGHHAIVMPLGFHYNRERMIDSSWWNPPNNNPPINNFSDVFAKASGCVPEEVLDKCIEKCAAKKLVHCDIEWRHVAIFPKRVRQPSNIELEYCFIDLSSMKEVASKKIAKEEMMKSKAVISR